jgi:hypothetical protein
LQAVVVAVLEQQLEVHQQAVVLAEVAQLTHLSE